MKRFPGSSLVGDPATRALPTTASRGALRGILPVVQTDGKGGIRTLGPIARTQVLKSHRLVIRTSKPRGNAKIAGTPECGSMQEDGVFSTGVPMKRRKDLLDRRQDVPLP